MIPFRFAPWRGLGLPSSIYPGAGWADGPARVLSRVLSAAAILWLAVTVVTATVVPWMDLSEVTARAEVVVLGTVESTESVLSDDGRLIVTHAVLAVDRALKGRPRDRIRVVTLGGKLGGQAMVVPGAPVFRVGERAILFLEPSGRPEAATGGGTRHGASRYVVVGFNQGHMRVHRDPRTGRDLVEDRTAGTLYLDRQGRPVGPERTGKGHAELQGFLNEVMQLVAGAERGSTP